MILYYSGANKANTEQNQAEKSLGGYISSSTIPNGLINSIFTTISRSVVEKNKRDTRLIVLTNTSGAAKTGVKVYIDPDAEAVSNIKIACVAPATDACSNSYFEQITSTEALPYQATLALHNGEVNAIAVGNMAVGASIGIWLSRELIANKFPTINGGATGISDAAVQALEAEAAGDVITEDNSNLVIKWD